MVGGPDDERVVAQRGEEGADARVEPRETGDEESGEARLPAEEGGGHVEDGVAADHDEIDGSITTNTINYADWEREWTRHPELLEMMSVKTMSAMVAELAGGPDAAAAVK